MPALMLADVSLSSSGGIGQSLILLVVVVIVLAFVWWVNQNYVPEPLRKFGVLVIVLLCVIFLINFVLSFGGHPFIHW
jgi:uncharacterized membrane protein YwzB